MKSFVFFRISKKSIKIHVKKYTICAIGLAFIINNDTDKKNEILKNDIFSNGFNRTILEEILPQWYIEKYIDGEFDIHETGREKGIIFGIPAGLIEGILVNNDIKEDNKSLSYIHEVFPNCYICDINGKVIIGNV